MSMSAGPDTRASGNAASTLLRSKLLTSGNSGLLCPFGAQPRDSLEQRARDPLQCEVLDGRTYHVEGADVAYDLASVPAFVPVYAPEILALIVRSIRYPPEVVNGRSS